MLVREWLELVQAELKELLLGLAAASEFGMCLGYGHPSRRSLLSAVAQAG
jgi:hypothetical protein